MPQRFTSVTRQIAIGICCSSGAGCLRRWQLPLPSMVVLNARTVTTAKEKGDLDRENVGTDDVTGSHRFGKGCAPVAHRQMPPAKRAARQKAPTRPFSRGWSPHSTRRRPASDPGPRHLASRIDRIPERHSRSSLARYRCATLLPKDEGSHGFDNVTVGNLSPLLDRFISAAQKISRLAVGAPRRSGGDTFRIGRCDAGRASKGCRLLRGARISYLPRTLNTSSDEARARQEIEGCARARAGLFSTGSTWVVQSRAKEQNFGWSSASEDSYR